MPQISSPIVNKNLRDIIFDDIFTNDNLDQTYVKINDRQYGVILYDLNGHERYVRIGVIVAEEREDISARDLMQTEIDKYTTAQANKAAKAKENAEKAARDAEKRAAKAKEKKDKENAA